MALQLGSLAQLKPLAPPPDPLERAGKLLQIKEAATNIQKQQTAQQKQTALEGVLQNAQWDQATGMIDTGTLQKIDQIDPEIGATLRQHFQTIATGKATEANLQDEVAKRETPDERAKRAEAALVPAGEREYQAYRAALNLPDTAGTRVQFKMQGAKLAPGDVILGEDQKPVYTAPYKPENKTLDEQIAESWLQKPENKGKTLADYGAYQTQEKIRVAAANRVDPTDVQQGLDENGKPAFFVVNKKNATAKPITVEGGGGITPKAGPVPATIQTNVNVAGRALDQTKIIRDILGQHPELVGPFMGRLSEFAQGAGSNPFAGDPKLEQLGATLSGHLRYLFAQELKNAIGARPGEFLAKELKEASPQRKQDINLLNGFLDSVENNAKVTLRAAKQQYQYDPFAVDVGAASTGAGLKGVSTDDLLKMLTNPPKPKP